MKLNHFKNSLIFVLITIAILGLFFSTYVSFENTGKLVFIDKVPPQDKFLKEYAYVSGAINNPGVYEIQEDTKILDIVNAAGGFAKNADNQYIAEELNLSSKVKDGDKIFIPTLFNPSADNVNTTNLISINNASAEELETLPGVGASTAEKIIQGRPYQTIEDLLNITGIGESKFDQIKELISL